MSFEGIRTGARVPEEEEEEEEEEEYFVYVPMTVRLRRELRDFASRKSTRHR